MSLTLSGPQVDLKLPYGLGAAISRAVTEAERARLDDASYYVRDQNGVCLGRVDREEGLTYVRRGYVQVNPDRVAEEAGTPDSPTRRPGTPGDVTKEEPEVAETKKTTAKRRSSGGKTKTRSSRSSSRATVAPAQEKAKTPAAPPAVEAAAVEAPAQDAPADSAAEVAAGNELYASLLAEVKSVVQGVEAKENKSHTYTRLLKGGKAFAYVFPPRKGGVALKIPKQLLAVAAELPEGHGFKTTGWGLTRTLKNAAETNLVAKALGVAAKAVEAK